MMLRHCDDVDEDDDYDEAVQDDVRCVGDDDDDDGDDDDDDGDGDGDDDVGYVVVTSRCDSR